MTLWMGHELATALATLAALLSVLTGQQLHPIAWISVLMVPVGAWMKQTSRGLSTALGGALALLAVTYGFIFTAQEGLSSVLMGAGYTLMLLVSVRLLNRETPAHDLQLYALSLLLVLDAAALNVSWLYAPCFLAYTIFIVWGLTTRELKRAAQDEHSARKADGEPPLWREKGLLRARFFAVTSLLSLVVLTSTLSLFIIFPRVGLGMLRLGAGNKESGFSSTVRLGESGLITGDNTVVMRVYPSDRDDPLPTDLYFRGVALDQYDGAVWVRSKDLPGELNAKAPLMPRAGPETTRYRVSLEPVHAPYLFTAGRVARVRVLPGGRILAAPPTPTRDGAGDLVLPMSPDELISYEIEADIETLDFASLDDSGPLPPIMGRFADASVLPERVTQLARQWTGGVEKPLQKVAVLADRLSKFQYTLEDEAPPIGLTPLEHFLFNRQAGHCEYFATALAMMSRAVGVPARVVGGYQGGAMHPVDKYLVLRQSDAHAWTEVYIPSTGWVPVDATPVGALSRPPLSTWAHLAESLQRMWEEYVVDFNFNTQVEAAEGMRAFLARLRNWKPSMTQEGAATLSGALVVAGTIAAGAIGLWLFLRRRPKKHAAGHALRRAIEHATVRVIGEAPPTRTVREWVQTMSVRVSDDHRRTLEEARDAYEQSRWGGTHLSPAQERNWVSRVSLVTSDVVARSERWPATAQP